LSFLNDGQIFIREKFMNIINYPSDAAESRIGIISGRQIEISGDDHAAVSDILAAVRSRGDAALLEYTRQFDAPEMAAADLIAGEAEFAAAEKAVDDAFLSALDRAVFQIRAFHEKQRRNSWISTDRPGVMLGQIFNPVASAGVYVPGARGGMTPLVSSVLMGAIPARIAGVEHVVMTTPPTRTGGVNPHLLVAARKAGVDVVYKAGSAWAVAALAYGTETIGKVDVIVGPGNIYVTLAKKMVSGVVGIDMIAGPSEILVVADRSADPAYVAADLLSQAEHDPLSSAVLVTDSEAVAQATVFEIQKQISALKRREIAEQSLAQYGAVFLVADLASAMQLANRIAPEHLELQIEAPFEHLGAIRNAGAVFIGPYTPEPVGDYMAGPNHVLPTAGTARFSSALSVDTFMKQTSLVHYSKEAFEREADDIMRLADTEGLGAHAGSVGVRLSGK
jgi:histidinol dehydrogenase